MIVNFYGKLFYFVFEWFDYKYMIISIVRLVMIFILRFCFRRKVLYVVKFVFICIYSMVRLLVFIINFFILFFKVLIKFN